MFLVGVTTCLVQACSEEYFGDGVRINVMNPERTATPMRSECFGKEPEESLLTAYQVAVASLATLRSSDTGQVVYVTRRAGAASSGGTLGSRARGPLPPWRRRR